MALRLPICQFVSQDKKDALSGWLSTGSLYTKFWLKKIIHLNVGRSLLVGIRELKQGRRRRR